MFDRRHPLGWLFYLLLAVAVAPAQTGTTTVSEGLFGGRSGAEKRMLRCVLFRPPCS